MSSIRATDAAARLLGNVDMVSADKKWLGVFRLTNLDSRADVLYLFLGQFYRQPRPVMQIHYTALPFVRLENGGLAPGEAVECRHTTAVIRRADTMVRNEANAGAVALARIESPRLGEFEEAVILKTFGDVPDEFDYI